MVEAIRRRRPLTWDSIQNSQLTLYQPCVCVLSVCRLFLSLLVWNRASDWFSLHGIHCVFCTYNSKSRSQFLFLQQVPWWTFYWYYCNLDLRFLDCQEEAGGNLLRDKEGLKMPHKLQKCSVGKTVSALMSWPLVFPGCFILLIHLTWSQ